MYLYPMLMGQKGIIFEPTKMSIKGGRRKIRTNRRTRKERLFRDYRFTKFDNKMTDHLLYKSWNLYYAMYHNLSLIIKR